MLMDIRRIIREAVEDQTLKNSMIDVNDDYAIKVVNNSLSTNYFIFSKKEQKVVSSFFTSLDAARQDALTRDVRGENLRIIQQNAEYIMREVPKFFLQEAGIDVVLDFLSKEDGSNIRLQWTNDSGQAGSKLSDFSKQDTPTSDNELELILQANRIPYSLDEVKNRLVQYFVRRLVYNVPNDRTFSSPEEALDFVKVYEQKFLYEYLIPMTKLNR